MSDIGGMVELCSAIHQKYAEFSGCLVENWTRMLTLKKDEKVANPSKMRVDLRYLNVCHDVTSSNIHTPTPTLKNERILS